MFSRLQSKLTIFHICMQHTIQKKKKKQYFQSSKSLEVNVSVELKINKVQFCSLNISPGVLVHTARLDLTHYSSSHKTATQKHLQTVSCYSVSKPKIQN